MPRGPQMWLIQANGYDPRLADLIRDCLNHQGVSWLDVAFDFSTLTMPTIDGLDSDRPIVCIGPAFIRRLDHSDIGLRPGAFFHPAHFRWSRFRDGWPDMMLSSDGRVRTVSDVLANPPMAPVFVRPDQDSKAFDGGTYAPDGLAMLLRGRPADLAVVCATPKIIEAEYRVFMVDGEVVAASRYRQDNEPQFDGYVPEAVIDLAISADACWRPSDAYVIDIARSGEHWGIVEANGITAARHYAADTQAIVRSLCRLANRC